MNARTCSTLLSGVGFPLPDPRVILETILLDKSSESAQSGGIPCGVDGYRVFYEDVRAKYIFS